MSYYNSAFTRAKTIQLKSDPKVKYTDLGIKGGCVLYVGTAGEIGGVTINGDEIRMNAQVGLIPIWFKALDATNTKAGGLLGLY